MVHVFNQEFIIMNSWYNYARNVGTWACGLRESCYRVTRLSKPSVHVIFVYIIIKIHIIPSKDQISNLAFKTFKFTSMHVALFLQHARITIINHICLNFTL